MGIVDIARDDFNELVSDLDGFGQTMKLYTPAPDKDEYIISGYHTTHHNGFDGEGAPSNTQNISIAIPELKLAEESYPYLTVNGEVNLSEHTVKMTDASGVEKHYMVAQWYPDRELGCIVVFLQDYTAP